MFANRFRAAAKLSNQTRSRKLEKGPDVALLTDCLLQVMETQFLTIEIRWPGEQGSGESVLTISSPEGDEDAKWCLYSCANDTQVMVWDYTCCDALLIYNMLTSFSPGATQISGDGLLATSPLYRSLKGEPSTYLLSASSGINPANVPEVSNQPGATPPVTTAGALSPKPINSAAIESVMMKLRDAQTGLFTYPAFLYFLQQEYFRACRTHTSISLVLADLHIPNDSGGQLLNQQQIFELVCRLSSIKRSTDTLAQYESNDLAVMLPMTDTTGARVFAQRFSRVLEQAVIKDSQGAQKLSFSIGLASFPQDSESLGILLAAAEAAKAHAKRSALHIATYSDLAQEMKKPEKPPTYENS